MYRHCHCAQSRGYVIAQSNGIKTCLMRLCRAKRQAQPFSRGKRFMAAHAQSGVRFCHALRIAPFAHRIQYRDQ